MLTYMALINIYVICFVTFLTNGMRMKNFLKIEAVDEMNAKQDQEAPVCQEKRVINSE